MVSTLAFVFKTIRHTIFSAIKEVFHEQRFFHSEESFPQSRKCSTRKDFFTKIRFFYDQRSFLEAKIFHWQKFRFIQY